MEGKFGMLTTIQLACLNFLCIIMFCPPLPDIDECREKPGICGIGQCRNLQGGYRCECPPGYQTSQDGKSCLGKVLLYGYL